MRFKNGRTNKGANIITIIFDIMDWKKPYGEYQRAWKGYDFDILNQLESEDMIGGSTHKAKSTYITEKGIEKAKELMKKYNIKK